MSDEKFMKMCQSAAPWLLLAMASLVLLFAYGTNIESDPWRDVSAFPGRPRPVYAQTSMAISVVSAMMLAPTLWIGRSNRKLLIASSVVALLVVVRMATLVGQL
ncbi:hypothetical protein [Kitasatospora sp. NPDC094015]|uniref:hypothetical protein n=1 Tax=Kitasatospora sp. NPDC094015 TaxID=3155205 RepID=UPI003319B8E8